MSKKSSSVESIELELCVQTKHQFDSRSPISPRWNGTNRTMISARSHQALASTSQKLLVKVKRSRNVLGSISDDVLKLHPELWCIIFQLQNLAVTGMRRV
ncbi:hypothetical protein F2Q69_00017633 [Brassica cretica]|uniref:Uncharacterized protein n=1 Tax=Brassica cretica TaxID=69181 RepID=A0A8S9QLZ8_BRACR|nr:hypothetical protein F2Q69_00017633 [Brassica cretica]